MNIKELLTFLKEKDAKGIKEIEFEDYHGNTLFKLSDLNIADLENDTLRLQDENERKFQVIDKGRFPITSLSKEDIIQLYEDEEFGDDETFMKRIELYTDNLTDDEMKSLASEMSDKYCDCCYWTNLKYLLETHFVAFREQAKLNKEPKGEN